ncbi:MAG: ribonuclease Z [Saprospiraceae bacterium]|nr:ribonuclease Z [Bacteroidia bacterium]NNE14982.1 ribonuclease Z [Saprospiraceae bacterium]NNL92180.1 ribonuclease Z [Saprospiraceae bacterium]
MRGQFYLTILGSNSATPAYGRFPTSQVLTLNDHTFLIDCGEGSQIRMGEYKIKRNKISHIFISHMHGDHIFGLPGLITSLTLNSRKEPLTIYGPKGIKAFLDAVISMSYSHLSFDLIINEIETDKKISILAFEDVEIFAFPVFHRIPTYGYLFEEKAGPRNILKSAIHKYSLSVDQIKSIKAGNDLDFDGKTIPNEEITKESLKPQSYAYCADSRADDRIIESVKGVSAMYFETTYLDDLRDQASERGHATSKQAAELALKANVNALITGHYSSRYKDVQPILDEAKSVFPNVYLGYDGMMLDIRNLDQSK